MKERRDDDAVTEEWLVQHKLRIPRAAGVFQSATAWVKVDGHGRIVAAAERDQSVLGWLIAREHLNRLDEEYGIAFMTIRSAFRGSLDVVPPSLYDRIIAQGGAVSGTDNAALYQQVCRDIGRDYRRTIEYACDTRFIPSRRDDPKDEGNVRMKHHEYRKAFSSLIKSLDDGIRELVEKRRKSS